MVGWLYLQMIANRFPFKVAYQLITDNLLSDLARLVEALAAFAIILTTVNLASHRSAFYEQVTLCQAVLLLSFSLIASLPLWLLVQVVVASPPCFYSHFE